MVGDSDYKIKLLNIDKMKILKTLSNHKERICTIKIKLILNNERYVFSHGYDDVIKGCKI